MINALLSSLPKVRGRYSLESSLAKITWFQVGGPAQILFKPADVQDLMFFLQHKPADVPVTTIGVGSNLLVRDGGIPGVVIRLGKGFTNLAFHQDYVDVGAAVLDRTLAMIAADESRTGLEYLCGIPGTIGGALRMNAGCYGTEMGDRVSMAFAVDGGGRFHQLTLDDLGFDYRHCSLPEDWIFVGARLRTKSGHTQSIKDHMQKLLAEREKTQPVHTRTGGSTFANPAGHQAWRLIDQAGCRGWREGQAQVSPLHCNFLINTGQASAKDLETLGLKVQQQVLKTSGITLRWEIKRIGVEKRTTIQQKEQAA